MRKKLIAALFMIFAALLPTLHAQTVWADVRGNYATASNGTAAALPDFSTGTWNYYASTTANPALGALTALTFGTPGTEGAGYGYVGSSYSTPAVADHPLFGDGALPGATFLAWHPGNSAPTYTVLRWTAGPGETGSIQIQGTMSKIGEPNGAVDFYIFVNGAEVYSRLSFGAGNSFDFNISATVLAGGSVEFVQGNGGADYFGDESLISGSISAIPEPATYAAILGALALGATGARECRCRRQLRVT